MLEIHRIGARKSIKVMSQNQSHCQPPHESKSQIKVNIAKLTNQSHKSKSKISSVKKRSQNQSHQSTTAPLSTLGEAFFSFGSHTAARLTHEKSEN